MQKSEQAMIVHVLLPAGSACKLPSKNTAQHCTGALQGPCAVYKHMNAVLLTVSLPGIATLQWASIARLLQALGH